jgi:ABC-type transport system involved in multi-copper enzyme maturation permease subunit
MWAIAHGLIIHNVRRSQVLGMLSFAVLIIWSSVDSFVAEEDLARGDLWSSRLALWSTLVITLFVVLQELPKEMASRFHLILLSKPITRYDYIIGKLLGVFSLSMMALSVLVAVSYLSLFLQCEDEVPFVANFLVPWFHYGLYCWLFALTACLCGAFLSEAFCLIGIGMVFAGSYAVGLLPALREEAGVGAGSSLLMSFVYYAVPNFQYFGPSSFEDYGGMASIYLLIYVTGYTGIVLPLSLKKFDELSFQ